MTCPHCDPREIYQRTVENKTKLYGEWEGWRLAGKWLIAPNGQRMMQARVLGMAWAEKRRDIDDRRKARERGKAKDSVIITLSRIMPARERFDGQA